MAKAKIAVNGYGTIGKRVADAVRAQDDMIWMRGFWILQHGKHENHGRNTPLLLISVSSVRSVFFKKFI